MKTSKGFYCISACTFLLPRVVWRRYIKRKSSKIFPPDVPCFCTAEFNITINYSGFLLGLSSSFVRFELQPSPDLFFLFRTLLFWSLYSVTGLVGSAVRYTVQCFVQFFEFFADSINYWENETYLGLSGKIHNFSNFGPQRGRLLIAYHFSRERSVLHSPINLDLTSQLFRSNEFEYCATVSAEWFDQLNVICYTWIL